MSEAEVAAPDGLFSAAAPAMIADPSITEVDRVLSGGRLASFSAVGVGQAASGPKEGVSLALLTISSFASSVFRSIRVRRAQPPIVAAAVREKPGSFAD